MRWRRESKLQQLLPGLWGWSHHPRGLRGGEFGTRTSYALAVKGEMLLVDPLVADDNDPALDALDEIVRGRVRIVITMPFHARSAERLWRRYRRAHARIYGHPAVATRLRDASAFQPVQAHATIGELARVHMIGSPPRSEQPIEVPDHRALVFGDSVIETDGRLRVVGQPLDTDRRRRWWHERYLPTLTRLADLEVARILVTHGRPVLDDGAVALRDALEHGPWQRPGAQSAPLQRDTPSPGPRANG